MHEDGATSFGALADGLEHPTVEALRASGSSSLPSASPRWVKSSEATVKCALAFSADTSYETSAR